VQRETHRSLELLAEQDPVSRPLARLQLEALRSASDPVWNVAVSNLPDKPPGSDIPFLHSQQIPIEIDTASGLIEGLIEILRDVDVVTSRDALGSLREIDPTELVKAAIEWDGERFEQLATQAGVDLPIVVTLGHCTALPVMLACGRHVENVVEQVAWEPGYCPVCANWPLIAEQRGLEKQLWLRCGRCSASWRTRHQRCVYCDNADHTKLGYLAADGERESRRAVTCSQCRGYLKVFATVTPLATADVLEKDLSSIELDIAATDEGYSRPERPGYPLEVHIAPVSSQPRSWFPWR
jgi:FdhE protein